MASPPGVPDGVQVFTTPLMEEQPPQLLMARRVQSWWLHASCTPFNPHLVREVTYQRPNGLKTTEPPSCVISKPVCVLPRGWWLLYFLFLKSRHTQAAVMTDRAV